MARVRTMEEVHQDFWGIYEKALEALRNDNIVMVTPSTVRIHPAFSVLKDVVLVLKKLDGIESIEDTKLELSI